MRSLTEVWNYKNIYTTNVMSQEVKSTIIVEGKEDLSIYFGIVKSLEKNINIKDISSCEGYIGKEGATYVMRFIEEMKNYSKDNNINFDNVILGIVDRDSICYKRKEEKENKFLYVLDYYAIESYYVNKEVINKTLDRIIINPSLVNHKIVDMLWYEIKNKIIEKLYMISLEALKKSCDSKYDAITGYKPDCVENYISNIDESREKSLKEFSKAKKIDKNFDNMLNITKGKWLLSSFCQFYIEEVKNLKKLCKENIIKKCDRCINNLPDCLYNLKDKKLNRKDLQIYIILPLDNLSSLEPIKNRLKELA